MKKKLFDIKRASDALTEKFFKPEQSSMATQEARQIIAAALIGLDEDGKKDLEKHISNTDGSNLDDLKRVIQQYDAKRAEGIHMTRSQISAPANSTNGSPICI